MLKYLKTTIIILILALTSTGTVYGLSRPATLKNLKVSVWPEYEKSSKALIIFRGQLPSNVKLPARVRFLFPNSSYLSSTSSVDDNGKFQYTKEWPSRKTAPKGNLTELAYNVYYPIFQFEIYNQIDTGKNKRKYVFPFKAAMDIDNLTVEVQQPLRSNNFKAFPKSTSSSTDDKGFKLQTYKVGKIKAGAKKTFSITYSKSDTKPSVEGETPRPVDTFTSQIPSTLIILFLIATLLAIPAAIFFRPSKKSSFFNTVKNNPSEHKSSGPKRNRFCTHCGTRLNPNSKFCQTCGKKL